MKQRRVGRLYRRGSFAVLGLLSVIGFLVGFQKEASAFTLGGSGSNLVGWDRKELRFKLNLSNCSVDSGAMRTAIQNAFDIWNSVQTSGIKLIADADTSVSVATLRSGSASTVVDFPAIVCDTNFSNTFGVDPNFVGGVGTFNTDNDYRINYGYLILNSQAGATANISNMSAVQLSILIAHEIGHVLGLGHTDIEAAVMYYSIGAKRELRLHQDDMDGISYLYPRSEIGGNDVFGCGTIAGSGSGQALKSEGWHSSTLQNFVAMLVLCMMGAFIMRRESTSWMRS